MKHAEFELQKSICRYLDLQYPSILYLSTGTSLKLTMGQAVRNKSIQKNGFKVPDLIILHPSGQYHGLFLELKIESPYKKNGEIKSNEHLQGQAKSIIELTKRGYYAVFAIGFDNAKMFIDEYLDHHFN